MPNQNEVPLRRICVRLYESDAAKLDQMAKTTGIKFNRVVREAIHNYVRHMDDRVRQHMDKLTPTPVEINLDELGTDS